MGRERFTCILRWLRNRVFAEASSGCHEVVFLAPYADRRPGNRFPALRFCNYVVNPRDLRVVEVASVGNKPDKEAFFGIVVDLGSVAGAVFARYQRPVPLTHVLVEFLLQAARVLRQGVRERVRDTRQRLRRFAPKFRLADTPLTLFPVLTVRSLQHQPESV